MIPFQFPEGQSAAGIIDRLRAAEWRGQVVGPHGSGKSTLMAALLPTLAREAVAVVVARLHADSRQLPGTVEDALGRSSRTVARPFIVIDGFEQLSPWRRIQLVRRCRHRGHGLLASAHRALSGLPVVYRTRVTQETAWRVVGFLLRERDCPFTPEAVSAGLAARDGNLREYLFDLYDWYEARRRPRG
jgi:hypothetical protein